MTRWRAEVARLDETTFDGRRLRSTGTWRWRPGAPLLYENSQIGIMERGEKILYDEETGATNVLRAYGTLGCVHVDVLDMLRNGDLYPEIDLGWATCVPYMPEDAYDAYETHVFTSGTVIAVHAGRTPAWPGLTFYVYQ